jgi:hypothetical protein
MPNLEDTQPKKPAETTDELHDTRPHPPVYDSDQDGIPAPPRILLWGVIGLFIVGLLGAVAGVLFFREVMTPGQQVRVLDRLPFMEAFLPPRPDPDAQLATAGPVDEEAAESLLFGSLDLSTPEAEVTEEATPETDEVEATEEVSLPAALAPTATEPPPTPVPPTAEPTAIATESAPEVDSNQVNAVSQNIESEDFAAVPVRTWGTSAYNSGIRHVRQTWNNCGPANITMALSYYGWTRGQEFAASYLKPEREDKNVSPHEMVAFVNEHSDIRALWRMGGDLDLLRTLLHNQFPVVIERSHNFEGDSWIGHYQTIAGYDDAQRIFYIYDSWLGRGEYITETYDEVDRAWQHFNHIFIVVYEPSREQRLMEILGERADPSSAAEYAFNVAQAEARRDQENAFAWFNMGTSLTELGRYEEASRAFDRAISIGLPWRMLWYQFGPFEAYYNVGRYEDVLAYVNTNLTNGGEWVEETFYWQGRAYAALGRTQEATAAFRMALRRNRLFAEAQQALNRLSSS